MALSPSPSHKSSPRVPLRKENRRVCGENSPFSLQQTPTSRTAPIKQPPSLEERIEAYQDFVIAWFFKSKKVGDVLDDVEAGLLEDVVLFEDFLCKCEVSE